MEIVTDMAKLHKQCEKVLDGEDVRSLCETLIGEMAGHEEGVGLAANQIGVQKAVFVMKYGTEVLVFVNPRITGPKGSVLSTEYCLSLPGVIAQVKRPKRIVIRGLNQYGKFHKYRMFGLDARVACHEVDHLFGILMTDLSPGVDGPADFDTKTEVEE